MKKRIGNKDLVQSYIWTVARISANVYEKRILYRIIEAIQFELEGKDLKGLQVVKTAADDRKFRVPMSMFLKDEKDENHTRIKAALISLRNRTIEFDDGVVWKIFGMIEKPVIEYAGWVEFEVPAEVYSAMLNFVKGYREFELLVAMSFKSEYTMRFFELFSNVYKPITYNIHDLKRMFMLEKKYLRSSDFIKYVIEPAQKELDEKAPWSFEYRYSDKDLMLGNKIHNIRFFPRPIHKNRDEELEQKKLQKQVNISWDFTEEVRHYLTKIGFTDDEVKRNIDLFKAAAKNMDLVLELSMLNVKAEGKERKKAWIIGALRGMLNDKGIILEPKKKKLSIPKV